VVEHEVTGYLVEADPVPFCAAMELLAADEGRARAMGRACVERVKRFTWERFVTELDDYVEAVAAGSRR
jgi:glycosyltransferase involved in cell wall biosynthesis